MNASRLHYLYDPLCGWCYGAAPLIKIARGLMEVQAHAGGMMTGERRMTVTPQLRQFVSTHDRRIAQATGQTFGSGYTDGLLRDGGAVFDSEPPITAVLAAEQLAQRGLDLLARLQTAHYVDGLRIAEPRVLTALAVEIGLDGTAFDQAFRALTGAATQAHIQSTRALMGRLGAAGFPTLAIERPDGSMTIVDIAPFYGKPAAWKARLRQDLVTADPSSELMACSVDGCTP